MLVAALLIKVLLTETILINNHKETIRKVSYIFLLKNERDSLHLYRLDSAIYFLSLLLVTAECSPMTVYFG